MARPRSTRSKAARRILGGCSLLAVAAAAQPGFEPADALRAAAPPSVARAASVEQANGLLEDMLRDQKTLTSELERVDARLRQLQLRTIARGRAYVRLTRAGLLPASGGLESLIDHASKVAGVRRALDRDLVLKQQLLQLKARLLKKQSELEDRLSAMAAERQLMERNRIALDSERDRALAFERAFASESTSHTTIYGGSIGPAEPVARASGFAALKGRLPFPLTGRTEIRAAKRRAASGPALEMLAPAGSLVRAVFPGTVAFADEYADYGRAIIVDHGDGFFTVSGNLATIEVEVGEDVGTGGRLGSIGSAGQGSLLYFEIRRGTDTLDPAEWFGI